VLGIAILIHTSPRFFNLADSIAVLETMYQDYQSHGDEIHEPLYHAAYNDLPTAITSLAALQKGGKATDVVFIGLLSYAVWKNEWTVHADLLREWQASKFSGGKFFELPIEYISHAVRDRFAAAGATEAAKTLENLLQNRRDAFAEPATASVPFFQLIQLLCRYGAVRTALEVYNRWLKLPREQFPLPIGAPSCYPTLISA
jgi:hypothetical protein